ncbi:MAG: diguanylate cyclase [Xanthomonadaceae bacterium]|nr:diguanylate cyclase [Xanthomonadaceae bacterium]MDE2053491.1 diguanylate cyclase [Xanthomonadaceae bacterium]MDE2223994.1 diguanylate cyclase [Xanthomonadaceae bacterium]
MAAVALLLIVALAAAVFQTAQRYRSDEKWTLHSYQVREQVLQLVNHLHLAEMEARSYGLTGREISFRQYGQAIRAVDDSTGQLATLVSDNPQQVAAVGQLRDAIAARREQFEAILNNYRLQGASAAHAEVVALVSQSTRPVDDVANRILAREADLLRTREAASARNGRTVALSAAVALGGSLALLLAAFFTVGLEQHRRRRSERALEQSTVDLQAALQEANRSSETLRRLSTLAELLQNCRDLDEAINVIERALPPLLSDVSGALALVNASRNIVEGRMHWGVRGSDLGGAIFAPDDCWALRRSQPHPGDGDHAAPICPHLTQAGVTADHTLCLPLNSQGQVLGVLSLCAAAVIATDTRRLAATAADQLALALANLQLQASLRTQSIRDPLTNLFNRRYLEASLPRELLRAERRKGGLSVLMFDLDHFKRYNDTQGHDAGDALLGAFGALLAQSCRGEDMPCRFGGEEFTLILTDADHAQARERAEAIRKATAELVVRYRAGTLPPATVSIGVATYPEHGATPEALLRMADQALYRAKQLGRNVVGSANDLARAAHTQPAQGGA